MLKCSISRISNIIISIISCIIGVYVYYNTTIESGYQIYCFVPIIFALLILICKNISFFNYKLIGPFIINISMLIRYIILPLIACLGNYKSRFGLIPTAEEVNLAIIYTIYEMICVCLFSDYLMRKYKKSSSKINTNKLPLRGTFIHFVLVICGIVTVLIIPETIADQRFILDQSNLAENIIIDFPLSGIFKTVFNFSRYSLILITINYFYKRNLKEQNLINIFIPLIIILANATFNSNLSRIVMLIPIITFTIILLYLFNKKTERKFILFFNGLLITSGLTFLTIIKFFGEGRGDISNSTSLDWWGDTLNMYFMGIKEIAIGIHAQSLIDNTYGLNKFLLLLNDVFSNVIGISNFTDTSINSTTLYNYVYFGSSISISQIVPNICEGIYYFTGIFSPIWILIFIYLAYQFSYKISEEKYIDKMFIYTISAVYCGMVMMINTSIMFYSIVNISLLFYLIILLNKKICLIRNR